MKKILLLLLAAAPFVVQSQCTTTNATDCDCLDGSSDCDLLPDITSSDDLLMEAGSLIENPGEILLSVGTPNIGHGPLRVVATDYYVCGGDTILDASGLETCPDGSSPHQIIDQRIYHKSGTTMTYWDTNAGSMTYHPDHGHFHTDNWGVYTLRKAVVGVDDPTEWPILGYGTKMGFCLMDLANCASPGNYGHCREDDGTVVTNDIENYGLGGGNYNCAITNQGISVGYLDIYDYYLDGMTIDVPAGVCNGDYYIVVEIDPNGNYLEESDNNNVSAVPFTLTDQPEDVASLPVTYTGGSMITPGILTICASESIDLSTSPIGIAYTWSNGATTNTITVTESGEYYCYVERECGNLYTDTITIEFIETTPPAIAAVEAVCAGTPAMITATAAGIVNWYDAAIGGILLGTGTTLTTADLFENTTFYAENIDETITYIDAYVGQVDHEGSDYSTGSPYNGYEVFDTYEDITLSSVKVITDFPGERQIELRNAADVVVQSLLIDIPSGTTVIDLNFDVPAGTGYRLGTSDDINTETFGEISPKLKRSSAGTDYPYNIDGLMSITNSSYDESRFYYFYDWHVTGTGIFACQSIRTPIDVEVKVCSAIGEISSLNSFNVYPNPANTEFNIALNTTAVEELIISVTNVTGQQIFNKTIYNANGEINVPVNISGNASGVYLVKVVTEGNAVSKNIIVE